VGFGFMAMGGGSGMTVSPIKGASQSATCSGSIAMYPTPATKRSNRIKSMDRPPPGFLPGFIGEIGLVAVVWSSSSSVN